MRIPTIPAQTRTSTSDTPRRPDARLSTRSAAALEQPLCSRASRRRIGSEGSLRPRHAAVVERRPCRKRSGTRSTEIGDCAFMESAQGGVEGAPAGRIATGTSRVSPPPTSRTIVVSCLESGSDLGTTVNSAARSPSHATRRTSSNSGSHCAASTGPFRTGKSRQRAANGSCVLTTPLYVQFSAPLFVSTHPSSGTGQ